MRDVIQLILLLGFLSGCGNIFTNRITISMPPANFKQTNPVITINDGTLTLQGNGLSKASFVKIVKGGQTYNLKITSKSDNSISTAITENMSMAAGEIFSLVVGNARGDTTIPATFTISSNSISNTMLTSMGASAGQVLKWNGTIWTPSNSTTSQIFTGSYDAATNTPELSGTSSFPVAGTYYLVTVSGSQDFGAGLVLCNIGDTIISTGTAFELVPNSNSISSVYGRTGAIVSRTNDYTWAQINKATSSIGDIADVNLSVAPANNEVLMFNSSTGKWVPGAIPSSTPTAGSITSSMLAGSISESQITNLNSDLSAITASIAGKEPNITSGSSLQYIKGDKTLGNFAADAVSALSSTLSGYMPLTLGSANQVLTTNASGALTWTSPASIPVTSVNSLTGAVVLTTSNISEGTNQYFTNERGIASTITTPTLTNSVITSGDTLQIVAGKLQAQVSAREPNITNGTSSQYLRGDKTLSTFATDVVNSVLTGFTVGANTTILTSDTVLGAFGKTQAQINAHTTSIGSKADATNITQTVTAATVTGLSTPVAGSDATSKTYVDGQVATKQNTISKTTVQDISKVRIYGTNTTNYVELSTATLTANRSLIFPDSNGTTGNVLTTDGAGNLSWTTPVQAVSSVNSLTGAVTLTTTNIAEGTNLYYTNTRAINAPLTGYSTGANTVLSASDTILGSLQKIQGQLNAKQTTTLASAKILVGNASNVATAVSMSGDATLDNSGAISLAASGAVAGTYTSVTVNSKGLITSATNPASTSITSLTGDITASGSGSVSATIGANAVTTSKIASGTILPSNLNLTGTSIATSGIMISNLTGGFSTMTCSTTGYVLSWSVTGWVCSAGGGVSSNFASDITVNGLTVGKGSGNISNNTVLGTQSLSSNTTGSSNTASGYYSLQNNTTGTRNTAVGASSLNASNGKKESTAIGYYSMAYADNTSTGSVSYNTAVGAYSLQGSITPANNIGVNNTSIGHSSLTNNTSGNSNVALGHDSLYSNTEGGFNTGVGRQSLYANTTGMNNATLGFNSGAAITTGSNNTIIGSYAGSAALSDTIVLSDGQGIVRMILNTSGTTVGSTSGTGTKPIYATAFNVTSDMRLKKDIQIIPNALERLTSLEGVTYNWNHDFHPELNLGDKHQMGVLAQHVEKVFPEAVSTNSTGIKSVAYTMLIAPIIESLKEIKMWLIKQDGELASIKADNIKKDKEIALLKARLDSIEKKLLFNQKI